MSLGPFSVHAGSSINVGPFVVLMPDGTTPDIVTPMTVETSNTNIRVGVVGSTFPDNRSVYVDGLTATPSSANVIVHATEGGATLSDSFLVDVLPVPNNSAITDQGVIASTEYPTPTR